MKYFYLIVTLLWAFNLNSVDAQFRQNRIIEHTAIPLSYEITLEPEIDENPATFLGNVSIELKATKNSNKIILSARDLNINTDTIAMTSSAGAVVPVSEAATARFQELFMIRFQHELQQNETYKITLSYSGMLRNDNQGFYLAKYKDEDGFERRLATTMFTKENARSAFPCFDDPAMKAQFTIKLIRPQNYTSVSNEEKIATENLGNGRYLDVFNKTCPMSTYLVAFTISDFKNTDKNGIHRIFARPQAIKQGNAEYALEKTPSLLKAIEEFVDMEYAFPKVDHVAIPDEFFIGEAQENWGLISYNERTLLYSNNTFAASDKQATLTSILHEFIHQWFGNLVTPSEWKYLWLSEGFATYLQFRIGDLIMPSWKLMEQFPSIIQDRAFEGESSFFRTPLNGEEQQDWVAYLKAASIIRMVESFLTPSIFKKGLRHYLKNNKFDVAKPSDLYTALQLAVNEENITNLLGNATVSDIMKTWDSSEGYPILNVTRNYENGEITLEQQEFVPYPFMKARGYVWYIPVNYIFNAESEEDFTDTRADLWLTEKVNTLNKNFPTVGWLIANKQFSGYYRVNYDLTNWNRLIVFLNSSNFERIHVLNRAQLIDDAFDLAKYGNLDYDIPLTLSKYLLEERSYAPFASFFNAVEYLNRCLSSTDIYPAFKNYIMELLAGVHKYLGYDENIGEDHLDTLNRANVLKWLCNLGHSGCRQTALQKLKNWRVNESAYITSNLQESLLCGAMRTGNQDDWNFLYGKYETARDFIERTRILKTLSCSENENILFGFLEKIRDLNSTLNSVDRKTALIAVIESGDVGLKVATNYIRQHFKELWKQKRMDLILNTIGSRLTTEEQFNEFKEFKTEFSGVFMAFRPAMALTEINLYWLNTSLPQISSWFNEH